MAWKGRAAPKPAPDGSVDPLHEPTIQRRLWALRKAKGYSRSAWAAVLGVAYSTVDFWDNEQQTPRIDQVGRQAVLLGVTVDDLVFGGPEGRAAVELELRMPPVLNVAEVRQWLEDKGATLAVQGSVLRQVKRMSRVVTPDWLDAFYAGVVQASDIEGEAAAWELSDLATDSEVSRTFERSGAHVLTRAERWAAAHPESRPDTSPARAAPPKKKRAAKKRAAKSKSKSKGGRASQSANGRSGAAVGGSAARGLRLRRA